MNQTPMTTTTKAHTQMQVNGWMRAAAVAAALVIGAAEVQAQYPSNNNGQARDASNRVGSGGSNGSGGTNRAGATGNQIVTGNVTGGREFRGPVGYTDSREFRDVTGSETSDRFVKNSAGARRSGTLLQTPTAFYGSSLAEPLPSTYSPTAGATGGYVLQQSAVGAGAGNNVGFGGVRPGAAGAFAGPLEQSPSLNNVDVSPLFGVRPLSNQSPVDAMRTDPLYSTSGDLRIANDRALQQMRDELNNTGFGKTGNNPNGANESGAGDNDNGNGNDNVPANNAGAGGAGRNAVGGANGGPATPLGAALKNDVGSPLSQVQNGALNSTISNDSVSTGVQTGQGTTNRLIVPPAQQSEQYKELVRRMQNRPGTTEGQDAADFNRLRAAQQQGKQPGKPGDAQPAAPGGGIAPKSPAGGAPAAGPRPGFPVTGLGPAQAEGPAVPTEPLEVKSLATGVKARGLASLLTAAEQSMKDQKYADAVGKYMQASRVAPNNPMITLGRGIAQLGGGNYGQAEQALRAAITSEPALLMGRYDLNGMLGETRTKYLAKDLKELAAATPTEARPRLLLAFLSYNMGNGPDAEKYVAEAAKLAPNDPVVQAMQKTWAVLGTGGTKQESAPAPAPTDLNK